MIEDHYILARRWKSGFDPDEGDDVLTNLLVWVRLPKLPMDYFDPMILSDIGNSIARYVKMDAATRDASRGHFARICVEVDLTKPLIIKYKLERRVRRLEYEGLHNVCFSCRRFGHNEASCPKREVPEPTPEDFQRAQRVVSQRKIEEEIPKIFEDFGPWMLAMRNRRRSNPREQLTGRDPRRGNGPGTSAPASSGSRINILEDLNDELTEHPSALATASKKVMVEEMNTSMEEDEVSMEVQGDTEKVGEQGSIRVSLEADKTIGGAASTVDKPKKMSTRKDAGGSKQTVVAKGDKKAGTGKSQANNKSKGMEKRDPKKMDKAQEKQRGSGILFHLPHPNLVVRKQPATIPKGWRGVST
ncbi:unnamed protein product [Linum tenue]|uniref:CCHC-type domain-containing protein n=4 Tax=Linum tenue TaxID=586396 RepID=A0AAV0IUU8_9ROSI|nr:unnamed protein product [Linum tenue]